MSELFLSREHSDFGGSDELIGESLFFVGESFLQRSFGVRGSPTVLESSERDDTVERSRVHSSVDDESSKKSENIGREQIQVAKREERSA